MLKNILLVFSLFFALFSGQAFGQTTTPPAPAGGCGSLTTVQNTFQVVGNDAQLSKGEVDVCTADAALMDVTGEKIPYMIEAKGNAQITPGDRLVRGQPGHFIRKGNLVGWVVTMKNPSTTPYDKVEAKDTLQGGFRFVKAYRLTTPATGNKLNVSSALGGQALDMRELGKDVAGITLTAIKAGEVVQAIIVTEYVGK